MSDRPSSDFAEFAVKNSIDACLANLADAEIFVCVISQRYGPSLKDAGFEDLSATHAELRAAHKLKKPIFLYARDRFVADYGIWKSNPSAKLNWVKPSDVRIFEMFAEHEKLAPGKANWVTIFRDSFELRGLLSQHLSGFSGRELLARWMREGRLPVIGVTGDSKKVVSNNEFALGIRISMRSTNTQVFGVKVAVSGEIDMVLGDLSSGGSLTRQFVVPTGMFPVTREISVEYTTIFGAVIRDTFGYQFGGGNTLRNRRISEEDADRQGRCLPSLSDCRFSGRQPATAFGQKYPWTRGDRIGDDQVES